MKKVLLSMMAVAVFCGCDARQDSKVNPTVNEQQINPTVNEQQVNPTVNEQQSEANEVQLVPGAMAPDFRLPTIDGKTLALSDLRGKYVVIDFWGSWCGWCIKGMPDMKKYYEKYAGKLEILGVDCHDKETQWRAAVEKLQLGWKHVRNGEGKDDVTATYAIQGYPTKVIVDPEGRIVKYIVGEDPVFYTTLDEVLQ